MKEFTADTPRSDIEPGTILTSWVVTYQPGGLLVQQLNTPLYPSMNKQAIDAIRETMIKTIINERLLPEELLRAIEAVHNTKPTQEPRPQANAKPLGPPFTPGRPTPPDGVQDILRAEDDFHIDREEE